MGNFEFRLADALSLAETINRLFDSNLPDPQIVPEEDGDISMEWYVNGGCLVNVWCRDGQVSWAGLDDGKTSHGCSSSTDTIIPPELRDMLRSVIGKMPK